MSRNARVRLRPLNEPRPVEVRTDEHGVPTAVAVERHLLPVRQVRESWRIDDEWWRRPVSRLYHTVILEGGTLVTVYRDLNDGRWYLQG